MKKSCFIDNVYSHFVWSDFFSVLCFTAKIHLICVVQSNDFYSGNASKPALIKQYLMFIVIFSI